ncbi:unnamed protein product [Urochloa humidicola]
MQRLFEVAPEDQEEADRVLDNYLKKRVRDMMYQGRVDAVKEYYRTLKQELDNKLACPIVLEYEQYLKCKIKWCHPDVWPELCRYWCSKEFLDARMRGQKARCNSDDAAQNHGGSRPFTETQQVLATVSSHVGSESTNNSIDVDGHDGEGLGRAHMNDSNHQSANNASV